MYAMIFLMIFGAAILASAGILAISKEPEKSIFLSKAYGIEQKSREEIKAFANKVAKALAIVGLCIIVICGVILLLILFSESRM